MVYKLLKKYVLGKFRFFTYNACLLYVCGELNPDLQFGRLKCYHCTTYDVSRTGIEPVTNR